MVGYLLYSLSFTFLLLATAAYFTRHRWLPLLPSLPLPSYVYTRLPSSFQSDIEAGLSSSAFDLSSNVDSGDSRQGLDERGKKEVQRIMKKKRVGFDEARRLLFEERLRKQGVGRDGVPRDPKFVSFS